MNQSNPRTAGGSFPTFRRFFGWLLSWRMIRRCLFVLACLVTSLALYHAEENWRGRRAWKKYRQELAARGERLDYREFIPKPVPDNKNFASTPFVQSWFEKRNPEEQWHAKDNYSKASSMVKALKQRAEYVDLVSWAAAFAAVGSGQRISNKTPESNRLDLESRAGAAPAVLEGLKDDEAIWAELRTASRRPDAQYPIVYDLENPWGILIPHLLHVRLACLRLQLRACAELAAGQGENALADVKLMLYLADSVKDEPFLISQLSRIACLQIALQPVWEGLAEHHWSEAQLQELQSRLKQYDFLTDLKLPLAGEQAAGVLTADLLARRKIRISDLLAEPRRSADNWVTLFIPRGWYDLEQLNYCRLYRSQLDGTFDTANKRVSVKQVQSRAHELEREISGGRLGRTLNAVVHHPLLAAMLLPALGRVSLKAATAQTTTDQAVLACALERFRLANGQFPERLDALVPRFLDRIPNDVISGEPLRYRRRDNGQFVLYSVGWNEKDDGGMPGKSLFDEKTGDWVWRYPEK